MDKSFMERMIARGVETERGYLEIEAKNPVPPLDSRQIAVMNEKLRFELGQPNSKGHDYRPYCVRDYCSRMPRMHRIKDGFRCWACGGVWDLSEHRIMPIVLIGMEPSTEMLLTVLKGRESSPIVIVDPNGKSNDN